MRTMGRALTAYEKRLLILHLVANGAEGQRGPVRLNVQELAGKVESRPEADGGRRVRYAASWPVELTDKELDFYSVTLAPPAKGEKLPQVLRFDHEEKSRAGAVRLEAGVAKADTVLWGLVAVEPATGKAWYRRLQLKGEAAK